MVAALQWRFHHSPARRLLPLIYISTIPSHHYHRARDLSLHNSQIQELSRLGRVDEARRLFDEIPHRDIITWNSMIFGYSQNRMVDEARSLFDAFEGRNVRTWTIVVSGYAKAGRLDEARTLFDSMPARSPISLNAMISGYVQNGDLSNARILFDGMQDKNPASWNAMVTGYCHAHRMGEARRLFDLMPSPDVVSWTVMISGYVQVGRHVDAWGVFVEMRGTGVGPDRSNFTAAFAAVAGLHGLGPLESVRALAVKAGFEGDVVVGTAVLNAYARCSGGDLDSAVKFFECMQERNEYTWSTMIAAFSHSGRLDDATIFYERDPEKSVASRTALLTGFAQNGRIHEARELFERIRNPNVVSWNAMIAGYSKNGMIDKAKEWFRRMPVKNSISWAAIISGCAQNGRNEEALHLLSELHSLGTVPTLPGFTSGFFACANVGSIETGRQLHALSIKAGSQFNAHVSNGLITMYAKCKNMEGVGQVFKWMKARDIVSWNSLIVALSQNDMFDEAITVFETMPNRDVVSWTAMISAHVQAEQGTKAMELFYAMLSEGLLPNSSTIASLVGACGSLGATKLGQKIHCLATKFGLESDLFVGNALISMYFKCGSTDPFSVFDEMAERDTVTWNSILAGCAHHGFGKEAIEIFEQMKSEGVLPNHVTFVGVLNACSHAGLVDEGWRYFRSMSRDYRLMPLEGHYACMVDLLGRAGHLYEAEAFIEDMPIEPDSVVWGALLGACRIHRNVELGKRVAERLFQMEPQNAGNYVLLSNIYASHRMWGEVEELRRLMRDRGVVKEPGCSWMQVKSRTHYFITGDKQHPRIEEIHKALKELCNRLRGIGYVPDIGFVLHDVEEEQKENVLLYHSEKLAVAFGIVSTPGGTPIRIMKNLRICGDCHAFIKMVSGAIGREIDVRDGNRFHHFKDGSCSCGDYW